ncbi:hypothetical protein ALC60_10586 [Trachymyrmex zeteki]|uniref:Secreted protein n=1 Tax=Mycetomoellerius zeteki TaxID=64791 RepID=A0A151WR38_9HYME|nr:PREDICTED: uncharacterized protein LOC108727326 [Trachymyrmex zeteki]KYQ50273.1 hypothetical protein ALC60_10586 [Trachymyrmex zeteki]
MRVFVGVLIGVVCAVSKKCQARSRWIIRLYRARGRGICVYSSRRIAANTGELTPPREHGSAAAPPVVSESPRSRVVVPASSVNTDGYTELGLTMSTKRHRGQKLSIDNKVVHEGRNR